MTFIRLVLVTFLAQLAVAAQLDLFSAPWDISKWSAVSDIKNGGESASYVQVTSDAHGLVFSGSVVIETRKAGFAAVSINREDGPAEAFAAPWWNLTAYDGMQLKLAMGDGKTYSINLRNQPSDSDSRVIDYKFTFITVAGKPSSHTANSWSSFVPTLKGEQLKDAPPLDPSKVVEIRIMCSSLLGRQEGPFAMVISKVSAVKLGDAADEIEENVKDEL
ncbi:hypothetical protein HDV05_005103 [Chytridiales sp. JEL 0842]|nr:hypothetical protein HDV05_005103 [Chytridiales sp. JEL 0842]